MAPPVSPSVATNKPTLLVIEDNADQWFVIRWALRERFSEVDPIWLADPAQAIIHLETCLDTSLALPKLILLDLCLPTSPVGLNTLRLLKRRDKLYCKIPTVVVSQYLDAQTIKEAYMGGATSYVAKPTTYAQWLDYVAVFRTYWWNHVQLPDLAHSSVSLPTATPSTQ